MIKKPIDLVLIKNILTAGIALVWLVDGLFCKVLNLFPRHQQIVSRILGEQYSDIITEAIGVSEILMSIWILSRMKSPACALTQILLVAVINILEFILAPDLLLFGRVNIIMAGIFILIIFLNEFIIGKADYKNSV